MNRKAPSLLATILASVLEVFVTLLSLWIAIVTHPLIGIVAVTLFSGIILKVFNDMSYETEDGKQC